MTALIDEHRRQAQRHPVALKFLYDDGESCDIVTVENISACGVFVRTPEPLAMGTEVYLVPIADAADLLDEVKARVVWVADRDQVQSGMGLEFIEPRRDVAMSLAEILLSREALEAGCERALGVEPTLA